MTPEPQRPNDGPHDFAPPGETGAVPSGSRATQWGSALVKVIADRSGTREVRIVKNREGTFGFEEWHLDGDAYGIRWIPAGQKIRTFADTAEVAEREARAGVDWLVEERLD